MRWLIPFSNYMVRPDLPLSSAIVRGIAAAHLAQSVTHLVLAMSYAHLKGDCVPFLIQRIPWNRAFVHPLIPEHIPPSLEGRTTPPGSAWWKSTVQVKRRPRNWPTSAPELS